MQKKFKIILDIVMLLMMLTLFSKQFFGMMYHEIAGLILIAVVILHIAVNIKTAAAIAKKFAKISAEVKIGLIVDILLFICFVWLGISGILSSHTILTEISSENTIFKLTHMFAGGASVILLGVHIGLHICRKPIPIVTAIILSVVVFGFGIYGAVNSSMGRWLSIPYSMTAQLKNSNNGYEHLSQDNSEKNSERVLENNSRKNGDRQEDARNGEKHSSSSDGRNREPLSPAKKIQNIVMFLGMILSFTMITYWIAVPKKKKTE